MKQSILTPQYVDYIPEEIIEGILYICEKYHTAVHKCCCGCGEEVVTPLTPADWSIRKTGNTITLHPSIGNWSFACQSHYWIRRNQVVWAKAMSPWEIKQVRARDQGDKEAYITAVNRKKKQRPKPDPASFKSENQRENIFYRLWLALVRWWN